MLLAGSGFIFQAQGNEEINLVLDEGTRAGELANWTVMVYMSGDSSLSDNVLDDLAEMRDVGSGNGLEIITLTDMSGDGDTKIYHILEGSHEEIQNSEVDASWGEELDLGDPDVLARFIEWAAEEYPAQNYLLDLWGHGNGWPGVCPDKGDRLTAVELQWALDHAIGQGVELDMISMDACQMGMVELFYQLRGRADYAIGSEKDVPLDGWPYDEILGILKDEPDIEPVDFGRKFVDRYISWSTSNSGYSTTLSLIDLDKMDGVASALDALGNELMVDMGYFHPEISEARAITEEYDGADQYDLKHLVTNMGKMDVAMTLKELGNDVASAVEDAVVHEKHWTRPNNADEPADNATGMSIWLPRTTASVSYRTLDLAEDTSWDEFLDAAASKWNLGSREESAVDFTTGSSDTDNDGLNDLITANIPSGQSFISYQIDFYDSDDKLVHSFDSEITAMPAGVDINWSPETPGKYLAAFYFRDANGILVNYSLIDEGLNSEEEYIIAGQVISHTGKRMRQVRVSVMDEDNNTVADTITDASGKFRFILTAPWDTNGTNMTIISHLGIYSQNVTLQTLEPVNNVKIEVINGPDFTLPLLYLALLLDIAGFVLVGLYLISRNRGEKQREDEPYPDIANMAPDARFQPEIDDGSP
ncbi:MAG: carboxypeptidase regulatory-like domain-containing protein [Thermoplasmata archaeon]|nr:carboxypeptidase regulatory-like domain-containing protein [Thermoplasmata archaeon]